MLHRHVGVLIYYTLVTQLHMSNLFSQRFINGPVKVLNVDVHRDVAPMLDMFR